MRLFHAGTSTANVYRFVINLLSTVARKRVDNPLLQSGHMTDCQSASNKCYSNNCLECILIFYHPVIPLQTVVQLTVISGVNGVNRGSSRKSGTGPTSKQNQMNNYLLLQHRKAELHGM